MWGGAGVAALFAALHLQADHVQMTYYLLFLLGAVAWPLGPGCAEGRMVEVAKTTGLLALRASCPSSQTGNWP